MLPDLITEGVLLHVGRYNSQGMERLRGNTIEDVNNPNLDEQDNKIKQKGDNQNKIDE